MSGGRDNQSEFDETAERLQAALIERAEPANNDVRVVMDAICRHVRWRFMPVDCNDIAAETVFRFIRRIRGLPTGVLNPAAYLFRIADNAGIDMVRRAAGEVPRRDDPPMEDSAVVDRLSALEMIETALHAAITAGPDTVAVKVLGAYLDLASDNSSPATRMVAVHSETSHTTVERVYDQARRYFDRPDEGWPNRTT